MIWQCGIWQMIYKVFSSEALKLLAQYNLLRPLVTAEVISEELKGITIEKEISDNLWIRT